jgi:hypothetical protein
MDDEAKKNIMKKKRHGQNKMNEVTTYIARTLKCLKM